MTLHTFKAGSLAEALRLIREQLGPDASVLHTRDVSGRLGRLLGKRAIEVTASVEVEAPSRLELFAPIAERLAAGSGNDGRRVCRAEASPAMERLALCLTRAGISRTTADRWLGKVVEQLGASLNDDELLAEHLLHVVAAELPVRGSITLPANSNGRPTIIGLVGATGVGKTTTVARLAADFQANEGRRVGLVGCDVFRIAAVEQLRAYAEMLQLPMEVVALADEMKPALARLSDCDVVLLDTAGLSPFDESRRSQLQSLLLAAQPDEVQLALSAVADTDTLDTMIQAFSVVGVHGLIVTKLDEVRQMGRLAEWLTRLSVPLTYTTHGQHVPGDLQPATALALARRLISTEHDPEPLGSVLARS